MPTDKHSKLTRITEEVSQLHPLLSKLLKKLPNVLEVEYTHGPREMGADFVIARQDETLGTTEYIGVVAKIGKVVQDYADIVRKIEECWVPRLFAGGKESIRLGEVWVIITEHITKGAQEKIYEKYRSNKITFIQGALLETLIDNHLPAYWTDVSLEVGEYLAELRTRTQALDKSVSFLQLINTGIYIEQDIYDIPSVEYKDVVSKRAKASRININEEIENNRILLIEGGMGSGKSKLIRKLVDDYSRPESYLGTNMVPIAVPYKDLVDKFRCDIEALITERIGATLKKELDAQKSVFLLLIDGIDEKNLHIE